VSAEPGRLLIIDDEESLGRFLGSQLESLGHRVSVMTDGADALQAYDEVAPEVVIVDLWMRGLTGLEVLTEIRRRDPAASVILLSGNVDVRTTVKALRAGAEDVQTKPVDLDLLSAAIDRGLERSRLMRAHRVSSTQISDPYGFFDDSPAMRRLTRLLEHLSQNTTPVLIVGEAGTGKGVVAEMLHQLSPRAAKPFVRVWCSGEGDVELCEALLGSRKGDGTQARGLLATAAGGTLFFDGVQRMSARSQELLLEILRGEGRGVANGSTVRVVATTERDLAEDVRSGAMRADLYQRLAVLPLAVPSLRTRGEEAIRSLALRTLHAQRIALGRGPTRLSDDANALLCSLPWPGNVRQLHQVIEESFLGALEADVLEPAHLREALARTGMEQPGGTWEASDRSLEQVERRHIARVLARTGGHRTEAAKILGITRTTLYKKMADYGLGDVGGE